MGAVALSLCASACGGDDTAAPAPSPSASPTVAGPEPTFGERAVAGMSLRDKAGQVIVTDWDGTGSPAPLVKRLHLGGVIAFGRNVSSPRQIRQVNRSVRAVVAARGWPAFVGVDQEGGTVQRIGSPSTGFPAFMAAGAAGDTGLTEQAARASAAEMRGLGFDVLFAPVADVTAGARDVAIGTRSAGGNARLVAAQVVAATQGIESAGVLPVVKHFPGHGSLGSDSHRSLPRQRASLAELERRDLLPFVAAIAQGAPAVLTGHIDVAAVDRGVPASLSRKVTTGLLRDQLGFEGLVVTDALDMRGAQQVAPGARAAVRALRAGADVVLMPPDPARARARIVTAVRTGALPEARLDEAAARMIDALRGVRRGTTAPVGSGRLASLALAQASLTSVAGPCRGRLLGQEVRVVGPEGDVAEVEQLLEARGVTIARPYLKRVRSGFERVVVRYRKKTVTVEKKVRKKKDGEVVVVVKEVKVRKKVPVYKRKPVFTTITVVPDAPVVSLVGYGGARPGPADVTVALDRPGVLGRVRSRVELATYGDAPAVLENLADALVGRRGAPGELPLAVPGTQRRGCGG
ncbi:beta-N-acetylhexosaminidase [Nocardioides scoriae]|uniref:beta-N-acetylhexosaminidase n=1 Tax=Nocardioides scoriae TaxID=642780 RepID=A0A1H1SYI3_9ACTN|nr:glycoside hydrolase family 3 N-terminal domain-containing protein [Nocardioides scoriae]SDS53040.1 beta-N-acetylhexosaminidase [Nocardioides scoriae]